MKKQFYCIVLLLSATLYAQAQNRKKADRFFASENFEDAMEEYLLLIDKKPDDVVLNYRLAVCFLNTNIDKEKAIAYLEKIKDNAKADDNTWYLLGRAYHFAYRFDDAIKAYQYFISSGKGSKKNQMAAGRHIEECENAKQLTKFPVNVKFENLGEAVNSRYPDYFPFVPEDESFLLFNTRRNDGSVQKKDGSFCSNIYISRVKDGKFTQAIPLTQLNTFTVDNEIVGLSKNGKQAIVYEVEPGTQKISDLKIVEFNEYMSPANAYFLPEVISTPYTEIGASIAGDSNCIYFASDMPGGYGGIDIYVSRKLPNGKWSKAQNLGPAVNTIYDEDFPIISSDGKTLYFSSKGHAGIGGYDIFKATLDEEKNMFTQTRNIGYPINTPDDDMNFCLSASGRYGYFSSFRKGGVGDIDIYRVTFMDIEPEYTVINGYLKSSDTTKNIHSISMIVSNVETEELYGEYLPNLNTMRYVIILPPGKFRLDIECEGFESYTEMIEIKDKKDYIFEIKKDIVLTPEK